MAGEADLKIFVSVIDKAADNLARIDKQLSGLGATAVKVSAMLNTVEIGLQAVSRAGAEIEKVWGNLSHLAEQTHKLQIETGLTAEQASGLVAVMRQLGMSGDEASRSLGIFSKNLENLALAQDVGHEGSANFAHALQDLGVSLTTTTGDLPQMDAALKAVADRFALMEDGAQKTGIAMDLFGRSGKDMIPILNQGAEGLAKMEEALARYGLVLDEAGVHKARELQVGLNTVGLAFEGASNKIVQAMLPALEGIAAGALYLAGVLVDHVIPDIAQFASDVGEFLGKAGEEWDAFAQGVGAVFDWIGTQIAQGVNEISSFFETMGKNFGAVIGGIASAAEALVNVVFNGALRAIVDAVRNALNALGGMINSFLDNIPAPLKLAMSLVMPGGFLLSTGGRVGTVGGAFEGAGIKLGQVGDFFAGLGTAVHAGLPAFPLGGGAGTGRGAGATGGGKGGGGKGAGEQEAEDIVRGFMEALQKSESDMEAQFGKLGGKLASAVNEGMLHPTTAQGKAIASAMEAVITDLRESGVTDWRELGDELAAALLGGLETKSTDGIMELIGNINRLATENRFWQEWAKAGEDAADKVNIAIQDSAEKITKAWDDFHKAVSEAQQALTDTRWLEAQRTTIDVLVQTYQNAVEQLRLADQRAQEDFDRTQARGQSRADAEAQHRQNLRDINRPAGQTPAQAENERYRRELKAIDERERREDVAVVEQRRRQDSAQAAQRGDAQALKDYRLYLEQLFQIDKATLENKALDKQLHDLATKRDADILAATTYIDRVAREQHDALVGPDGESGIWGKLIEKMGVMVGMSAQIAANLGAGGVTPAGGGLPELGPGHGHAGESGALGPGGGPPPAEVESLQRGGYIRRGGLVNLHAGELVLPAGGAPTYVFNGPVFGDREFWDKVEEGIRTGAVRSVPSGH